MRLLYREAMRLRAETGLLDMATTRAGVAPLLVSNGRQIFEEQRKALTALVSRDE